MARAIDVRSDTVTQPTEAMRSAMAVAVVGDDGYGEDPTIRELEGEFAALVGKEAAIFVPSGVMANQMALRVLTLPGDLVVTGRHHHVVSYEMGASARNASIQFAPIEDSSGFLDAEEVAEVISAEFDHQPHIAALCLENTHMYAGGVPWGAREIASIVAAADGRPTHLDGARLFNASAATGEDPSALAAPVTTVMTCLSKGLCAPVGSLLAGPADLMDRARVERKRLGGTMRQGGILAAAGLVALRTMRDRLVEDHRRARALADAFSTRFPESAYDPESCATNIVAFDHERARELVARLDDRGLRGGTLSPRRARFVTHAGITDDDVDAAVDIITSFTWA